MHHNYIDMQGKCNKISIPKQVKIINYITLMTFNMQDIQLIYVDMRHNFVDMQLI